jgi:transcriptional regulator with XRE-family HTH domain
MSSVKQFSGSKIREARHDAGLTQAALAHAINTRERNIIRWENNQHEPRFEHVAAIAKATGHPLEFFTEEPCGG